MNVLHINGNYVNSSLHQCLVDELENLNISNQIFVPINKIRLLEKNYDDKSIHIVPCFKSYDRLFFHFKQRKIKHGILSSFHMNELEAIQCIHAHTLFTDGSIAEWLKRKYNKPYIVAVRSTDVNDFFKWAFHLRTQGIKVLRNANAIIFLSPIYKDKVFKKYIPKRYHKELLKKSVILPNGIDNFWINNRPTSDSNIDNESKVIRLISVCEIIKRKNLLTVIDVCNHLRSEGLAVHLEIIGKVINKRIFKKIKKNNGITYSSPKPKEVLINDYRNNDIFIMPSYNETFGLVYAEAMSQGLPVIYSRGEGFDGQFPEGEVGHSVNCMNIEEIASTVKSIYSDKKNIGKRCVKLCEKFDWHNIAVGYQKLYEKVCHTNQ